MDLSLNMEAPQGKGLPSRMLRNKKLVLSCDDPGKAQPAVSNNVLSKDLLHIK